MYLDQKLNDAVFQTYPYNLNNQIRVRNKRDLLVMAGAMGGADPVLHYTQLGNDLKDGVFAWINFAIDPTADEKVPAAGDCSGETCVPQEVFGWFKKLMLRVVLFPNIYIWKAPVMHEVEGREKGGKVRDEI